MRHDLYFVRVTFGQFGAMTYRVIGLDCARTIVDTFRLFGFDAYIIGYLY